MTAPRVTCLIPCYNVQSQCAQVVREVRPLVSEVIAVDDGSTDGTREQLSAVASEPGEVPVHVLKFDVNRGKGAALIDGMRDALSRPFDWLVTFDGDRQHQAADIPRLIESAAASDASLVIGERFGDDAPMPLRSRFGNSMTRILLKHRFGRTPRDTQSGLRAISRRFVEEIVETTRPGRYETELEILMLALRNRHQIGSVNIPTIYIDGNRLSHFRPFRDSLRVYRVIHANR